jgi:hypothetical protein
MRSLQHFKKMIGFSIILLSIFPYHAFSQSWNINGNAGINAATNYLGTKDQNDLVFRTNAFERGRVFGVGGTWRLGSATNNMQVDSLGHLTFAGQGAYRVDGNKYVFQFSNNPNYGLFFNSTVPQYEFRNGSTTPVFFINANTGAGTFAGTLKIGAYTLPSTDGTSGQVLTTSGSGAVSWSNVSLTSRANTSLSNLAATTAINAGLIPKTNNSISLGSSGKGWTNIYIDSALYIGGTKFLTGNASSYNTGVGLNTLSANAGSQNVAIGTYALHSNTTGSYNTANGYAALYSNTTGSWNTANGLEALFSNTTGYYNTADGEGALYSNTTGYYNTATGWSALSSNTTGIENTANGYDALSSNTTGNYNTANGEEALFSDTSGNYNTATGSSALYSNTTGLSNTANGYQALYFNTTGQGNTASGIDALALNTMGSANTANGTQALYSNTSGNYNTANGYWALQSNTTGYFNTALGFEADVPYPSDLTNATAIGYGAVVDASNKVRIGNAAASSIGGQVGWTTFSDGRYKKNIKDDVQGLKFINLLKPITYTVDINGLNNHYGNLRKHDSAYDKAKAQMQSSADAASKIIYNGFIAQDVEKAAQSINYNFSGVDKPQNKDGLYGLRYSDFVVPLVKAVQELSSQNDSLKSTNSNLQSQLQKQQSEIDDLKALVLSVQQQQQSCACSASVNSGAVQEYNVSLSNAASLEQNIPNPFTNTTTIGYTLPQKFSSAQIIIADKNGKALKQLTLSGAGKGSVYVDASMMAAGAYNYTLYVDGKMIDSKQMVTVK